MLIRPLIAVAPASTHARALLAGSVYAADASAAGCYRKHTAPLPDHRWTHSLVRLWNAPPTSLHTRALLAGTVYGADASGAGAWVKRYVTPGEFPVLAVEWDVDCRMSVTWTAGNPASFWPTECRLSVEFEGRKGHVARFDCPCRLDAEFQGSEGPVHWVVDCRLSVEWFVRTGTRATWCLAGDGTLPNEETNYVF